MGKREKCTEASEELVAAKKAELLQRLLLSGALDPLRGLVGPIVASGKQEEGHDWTYDLKLQEDDQHGECSLVLTALKSDEASISIVLLNHGSLYVAGASNEASLFDEESGRIIVPINCPDQTPNPEARKAVERAMQNPKIIRPQPITLS